MEEEEQNDSEESQTLESKTVCQYCAQAIKNEALLKSLERDHPHDFHDWKVTIVFYISLHYLKGYAVLQGIFLDNHDDTFGKLYGREGKPPELKISKEARDAFRCLFKFSMVSRYNGYLDEKIHRKAEKLRFRDAKEYLVQFKAFVIPELKAAQIELGEEVQTSSDIA